MSANVDAHARAVLHRAPEPPPGWLRRLLFRIPLWLHHLGIRGLERALGIDWVVLETRGRTTGLPHRVMLDVIAEDLERTTVYVQPARGRTADWVRNAVAHPIVRATLRGRSHRAHVTDVTGTEGAEVVLRFLRTHPCYGRIIVWFVGYVDGIDRPDDELRAALETVPVFALRRLADDGVET